MIGPERPTDSRFRREGSVASVAVVCKTVSQQRTRHEEERHASRVHGKRKPILGRWGWTLNRCAHDRLHLCWCFVTGENVAPGVMWMVNDDRGRLNVPHRPTDNSIASSHPTKGRPQPKKPGAADARCNHNWCQAENQTGECNTPAVPLTSNGSLLWA